MIIAVIVVILLMLLAFALLLRYERLVEREPEHGKLNEPLLRCVPRGIKNDLSSLRQWMGKGWMGE